MVADFDFGVRFCVAAATPEATSAAKRSFAFPSRSKVDFIPAREPHHGTPDLPKLDHWACGARHIFSRSLADQNEGKEKEENRSELEPSRGTPPVLSIQSGKNEFCQISWISPLGEVKQGNELPFLYVSRVHSMMN